MKTVSIRVLRNLGQGLPPYKEGDEVDAKEDEAQMLIERGLAEKTEPPKVASAAEKKVKAIGKQDLHTDG